MSKRMPGRARRMAELLETAEDLHRSGLMTRVDYNKVTRPIPTRAVSRDRARRGARRG
jgi:hypothetical protein